MANDKKVKCSECKSNVVKYCDDFPLRDWSGFYQGDAGSLPKPSQQDLIWTYQECKKNNKGLKYLNLIGDCQGFEKEK